MHKLLMLALLGLLVLGSSVNVSQGQGSQAYGRQWGRSYGTRDWNRFYHYPYVYYPQNFWSDQYYQSSDDLYHRYPSEMRTPVYNKQWHNMLPEGHVWHSGHHHVLDQF